MDLSDVRREFQNASGRLYNDNAIYDAKRQLTILREEYEYAAANGKIDPDTDAALKVQVARRGLELLQRAIPTLEELGHECLAFAGKSAVRVVCAPMQKLGTDRNGEPFKPVPSGFRLPPSYEENSIESAVSAVKRVVGRKG